ncbi:unnamed protein product [Phytophthora lilii]|uniref:Pectinesterase n=1 Tax=Phytophthora lilii TaxID=2077276 RepID=A0A9W6YJ29_9STRA|nr:unnamed protein product [Phytophthora lilii]
MRSFVLAFLALVLVAITAVDGACSGSNARVTPPSGAIVVDASGSYKNSVKTVSAGVAKLSSSTTSQQTIFILPGTYREQVLISALNGPLVVQGYTCDTTSYSKNQVTITHTKALKDDPSGGDEKTSTLRLKGKNVKLYNLNIANPEGKIASNGQALALYNDGSNYGFYACSITGYQDTVCANNGVQIFAKTHISGATDFIFGQHAQA